ncbi:LITAF domain-containing protein [Entamoeba marina]
MQDTPQSTIKYEKVPLENQYQQPVLPQEIAHSQTTQNQQIIQQPIQTQTCNHLTFSRVPQQCFCPYCNQVVVTEIQSTISINQVILCFLLCISLGGLLLCCLGLVFLYFPSLKSIQHKCPICKQILCQTSESFNLK